MNRKSIVASLAVGVAIVAAAALLVGIHIGDATAPSNVDFASRQALPPRAVSVLRRGKLRQTEGYNVYNDSAETLVYVSTTGNVGVPPTAPMVPGSMVNLEVPATVFHDYSGHVTWNIVSPTGASVGTLVVGVDELGNSSEQFTATGGGTLTTMTAQGSAIDGTGETISIVDAKGSPATQTTYAPGSDAEQAALTNLCSSNPKACTFTPTAKTNVKVPALLAEAYNGGDAGNSTLETDTGFQSATTDTWGVSLTTQVTIAGIVQVGVTANYGQSVHKDYTFQTNYSIPVAQGETGYIYGAIPKIQYTGTFTAVLGNTTFTLPGVSYLSPNTDSIVEYSNTSAEGNVPLVVDPGVTNKNYLQLLRWRQFAAASAAPPPPNHLTRPTE